MLCWSIQWWIVTALWRVTEMAWKKHFLLLYFPLNCHKVSVNFLFGLQWWQSFTPSNIVTLWALREHQTCRLLCYFAVSCPSDAPFDCTIINVARKTRELRNYAICPEKIHSTCVSHTLTLVWKVAWEKEEVMVCIVTCRFSESSCKHNVLVNSGVPCVDGSCRLFGCMITKLKTV